MMFEFDHLHTASRFSVSAEVLEHWLGVYRTVSDLMTVTEIDKNDRARKLNAPGWGHVYGDKGPRDDCGIAWRESVFAKVWAGTVTLSDASYRNKRGWMTDTTEAAYAVLETKTGKRLVVGVAHLPTKVAGAKAYRSTVRGFKAEAQKLAKKYDADAIMLVADWNKNLRLASIQRWTKVAFKGYRSTWKRPYPKAGTFGKALIDFALVKGLKVKKAPVLRKHDPSSDHTAFRQKLAL